MDFEYNKPTVKPHTYGGSPLFEDRPSFVSSRPSPPIIANAAPEASSSVNATLVLVSLAALAVVVVPLLYVYTRGAMPSRFPTLRNKRICLLIAHPDDEAMFFAPTVLALTRPELGNHVKILCLTTGNADGLGETRRQELMVSALLLGLRKENDVYILDRPDFPDSMTTKWDPARVSDLLCEPFAPHLAQSGKIDPQAPVNIDVLLTFDASGVSGHPNHTALYHGARAFISRLAASRSGSPCPVDLYTLTSVNVLRKYSSILDMFATLAMLGLAMATGESAKKSGQGNPEVLVNMNALWGSGKETYAVARQAMTDAHKSQMVWFRWGWITLSRYMLLNDLRLERIKP